MDEQLTISTPEQVAFQYEMAMESRRRPELLATNRAIYEQYHEATQRELVRRGLADDPAHAADLPAADAAQPQ